jgi:two-component system NtrC family sensor kinase
MGELRLAAAGGELEKRRVDALIVEDVEGDARLIVKALTRAGFAVNFERVESRAEMNAALDHGHWDIVISDCSLPKFSAAQAIALLQERHIDLPIVVVSGVVREDAALQLLHSGAHDFFTKGSLARLAPAVARELDGVAQRLAQLALRDELERRARASETRFRNFFDLAPDGVLFVDLDGMIVEVNRRACVMFGHANSELVGLSIEQILPLLPVREMRAGESRVRTLTDSSALTGLRRDGQVFPVEVAVDCAEPQLMVVTVRDVTERQRNREELQLALSQAQAIREQLDSVLDCAPAYIVALDSTGAIKFINRVADGRRKEEVVGLDWVSFVPLAEQEQTRAHLQNVLRTGEPASFELVVNEANGRTAWYSCFMGPMRSGDQVTGAVIIAQETTAVRRVQDELAAAQRLAAVGTLAAGIAHEINTPMQFVSDSLHFLRESARDMMTLIVKLKALQQFSNEDNRDATNAAREDVASAEEAADLPYITEQVPKAFERCIDGLGRMTAIVRSLKEFAHPATQEPSAVDLNRAIQNTLTIARNEYKYVADLETDLGDVPWVVCHVNDINQVVLNLVVNAAHAITDQVNSTGGKGVIRVVTRSEGEWVVVSISDTGGGIPEQIRHRVFEPFFTTKEVGKGTGQGLAIAWSIVEKHRGTLTFETEPGKGTTFFIRLPAAGTEPSESIT